MTVMYEEGKPSPEEYLAHYGKKGMKWGVRHKPNAHEIRSARARLGLEQDKLFVKAREVKKTGKGQAGYQKQKQAFLNNPDRVTATKLTKGEKAAQLILAGPVGLITIGTIHSYSKRIERKQASGAYNRKK